MIDIERIDQTLRRLVQARGAGKTICPSEVARDLEPDRWRSLMKTVRVRAVALAKRGEIQITRKGKAVDPDQFKGVYRLRLPE